MTVLRNPVERLLSNYYFWKRHRPQTITRHKLRGPALAREGDLAHFLGIREGVVLDSTNNMVARRYAGNVYAWPDGSWCARSGNKGYVISDLELVHRALGNLLTFDLVGDISKLHAIYSHLAEIFGMAPLNRIERLNSRDIIDEKLEAIEEEPITPEVKKMISEFTRLDRIVFRLARTHFKNRGSSFKM